MEPLNIGIPEIVNSIIAFMVRASHLSVFAHPIYISVDDFREIWPVDDKSEGYIRIHINKQGYIMTYYDTITPIGMPPMNYISLCYILKELVAKNKPIHYKHNSNISHDTQYLTAM